MSMIWPSGIFRCIFFVSVIVPILVMGRGSFQLASNLSHWSCESVKSSSKSSPSLRAEKKGSDPIFASSDIGIDLASRTAPTRLWAQMRLRSLLRPSLMSIIELSLTREAILRASLMRGVKLRCLPSNAPPSEPVTQIASPTFAPFRRTGGWPAGLESIATFMANFELSAHLVMSPPMRGQLNLSAAVMIPE